jgi:hypothetical protein
VLAIAIAATSAEAGGYCTSYGHYSASYPSISYRSLNTTYYGAHSYWPAYRVARPISYPVTYYDCYGRPYVVLQTTYSYLP